MIRDISDGDHVEGCECRGDVIEVRHGQYGHQLADALRGQNCFVNEKPSQESLRDMKCVHVVSAERYYAVALWY